MIKLVTKMDFVAWHQQFQSHHFGLTWPDTKYGGRQAVCDQPTHSVISRSGREVFNMEFVMPYPHETCQCMRVLWYVASLNLHPPLYSLLIGFVHVSGNFCTNYTRLISASGQCKRNNHKGST